MERRYQVNKYSILEDAIGYHFNDITLLERALTHSSYAAANRKSEGDNERMEFLGDAVLELCVSEALYFGHDTASEGVLTRARASLVCESALFEAASRLNLSKWLFIASSEESTGGRLRHSINADAFEAVICAVYMDGGIEKAKEFITRTVLKDAEQSFDKDAGEDYKTQLQEYIQRHYSGAKPEYIVTEELGPAHSKTFTVNAVFMGRVLGSGSGATKKAAGQAAARQALESLKA
ncbi:MAG TPA: ribonuclease III [Eubacteriales bacterium]|nr:ribonuclease III [Clostridia bacterium]HRV72298.1 ribonuclease III [Eubacteriales bacterium]